MSEIYLDNAALKKPTTNTLDYVCDVLKNNWHNPNSLYQNGANARKLIETSKNIIAKNINCDSSEIIFCSCGSEANSLATCGYIRKHNQSNFVTSTIEHSSILDNPYAKKLITVDRYGFFDIEKISNIHNSLISLQMANSEIGTIQNIKKIVDILHKNNCVVHTDAVAAFGQIKINVKDLNIDMLTAAGQKIGGILGASFLYKKKNIDLEPLVFGHDLLRSGTPNVLAISALGKAIEQHDYSSVTSVSRDYVYNYIIKNIPDSYIVGADIGDSRLPHNLYMCFKGVEGESLMLLLDMNGIQVSTGSACNNYQNIPSATLTAIGMNKEDINSCIRLSFSGNEHYHELNCVCEKLKECVERLRNLN